MYNTHKLKITPFKTGLDLGGLYKPQDRPSNSSIIILIYVLSYRLDYEIENS